MDKQAKIAEYIADLNKRYPKGNECFITDLQDYMNTLDFTQIDITYHVVKNKHRYNTFPNMPTVFKYLAEDGHNFKRNQGGDTYACNLCQVCHTKFSLDISACPTCRKRTPVKILVKDRPIDRVKQGHDDCGYCDIYFRSSKGAVCLSWGQEKEAGDIPQCQGCTCIQCCKNEYLKNTDYGRYRREVLGYAK